MNDIEDQLDRLEGKLDKLIMPHVWGKACAKCGALTYRFEERWICLRCGGHYE